MSDYSILLTTTGLILDLIGAIFLARHVWTKPWHLSSQGDEYFDHIGLMDAGENDRKAFDALKNEIRSTWIWGKVGIILLIIGFSLQIIGQIIPIWLNK